MSKVTNFSVEILFLSNPQKKVHKITKEINKFYWISNKHKTYLYLSYNEKHKFEIF